MPCIEVTESCPSTNAALAARAASTPHGFTLCARVQTAGRGQRGNSWEAEPYKNLTFSILLRPQNFAASRQFELSMLVALAVADTIDALAGSQITQVKWPNDIYVGHSKICGILIENSLIGANLDYAIAGVGVNINQTVFRSDAPNPISLASISGKTYDLDKALAMFAEAIAGAVAGYDGDCAGLLARYQNRLWRSDGVHPFREPGGPVFSASITAIDPAGPISLSNGKTYAFKEIVFVL